PTMITRVEATARRLVRTAACVAVLGTLATQLHGDVREIDVPRSSVTVYVYKTGLFSAFADNHVINAPIARSSISEDAPLAVAVTVRSADLRVLDPGLSADRRAEIQARMLGSEVLDAPRFPEISFVSTAIVPSGEQRWQVTGQLTIRDRAQTVTFAV